MGYFFYKFDVPCKSTEEIVKDGGEVVLNQNGTVSVYLNNGNPLPLRKPCCELLNGDYTWDADTQECRWGRGSSDLGGDNGCDVDSVPFNIVLNPVGDDGAIFGVEEGETCSLDISFDYLFKFDCTKVKDTLLGVNGGLSEFAEEDCAVLEQQKTDLETEISTLESTLVTLYGTLEDTPYVIVCEDIKGGDDGSDDGSDDGGDIKISETRFHSEVLPNPYDGKIDLPPTAFPVEGTSSYCLTALGLQSWETILGTVNYTTWFNSEGTNITLYGCSEVDQLIALDGGGGTLLGSCTVGINERQIILDDTILIMETIKGLVEELLTLNNLIDELCRGLNCDTAREVFENLDVCMTLDVVDPDDNSLSTVFEETIFNIGTDNLYEYLTNSSGHTGLIITGGTNGDCNNIGSQLVADLVTENIPQNSDTVQLTADMVELVQGSFDSPWLEYSNLITDPNIISQITGKKIKISIKVKDHCTDFCILVDRLRLDKDCTILDTTTLEVATCPSFDLLRVCDNKKSWLANEDPKHREFDLKLRDTQYDINNYKLALNSKEVDLDINTANAIEQDVFCYIQDNPCLLECSTGGTSSITFETNLDFEGILLAETICCDASYTSACTLDSQWNIVVNLGCESIYSNDAFYTSTGPTDVPTEAMYITELENIATALDLTFTTGATSVTFTHTIDCDEISFLDKTFSVNLGLDITTTCGTSKLFQDDENFSFQDGEDYDFN